MMAFKMSNLNATELKKYSAAPLIIMLCLGSIGMDHVIRRINFTKKLYENDHGHFHIILCKITW